MPVILTGLNTFVLIISSVTMVKAFSSIQDGNQAGLRKYLLATMAGGMFFTVAEIGGGTGPLAIGLVADASGGFAMPLWMCTGVAVALLFLLGLLQLRTRGLARNATTG